MPKYHNEQESYSRDVGFDIALAYDSSSNIEYVGKCYPGGSTSQAVWSIFKLTYDGSGNITLLRWADGSDQFNKKWSDYLTYTYG